jgi:hypothetical protein
MGNEVGKAHVGELLKPIGPHNRSPRNSVKNVSVGCTESEDEPLGRRPLHRLDVRFPEATISGVPDLVTFTDRLRRDRAALVAALTLPWSTGPVKATSHG